MNSGEILDLLQHWAEPLGLESYLFKLSWYNEKVLPCFEIPHNGDTVCAVILSTPSFFEKTFLPFVKNNKSSDVEKDLIDKCIAYHVDNFITSFPCVDASAIYDYELLPNRRPKILVQTAAHVAGAAFYYQRKHVLLPYLEPISNALNDVTESKSCQVTSVTKSNSHEDKAIDPWKESHKIFGVCVHPEYGGWFAIRCVIMFHKHLDPHLKRQSPVDCVPLRQDRIELLNRFNKNWKDWTYRDIIPAKAKYSEIQKQYFSTLPKNRIKYLKELGMLPE